MKKFKITGVFHSLRRIGAGFFMARTSCKQHAPELSLSLTPLSKICAACGKVEPLDKREIFWPSNVSNSTPRHRLFPRRQKHIIFALMVSLVPLLFALHSSSNKMIFQRSGDREAQPFPVLNYSSFPSPSVARHQIPAAVSKKVAEGPAASYLLTDVDERDSWEISNQGVNNDIPPVEKTLFTHSAQFSRESERGSLPAPAIETQIVRAIAARAISGVKVTFDERTAHLQGVVQTESQKAMAERAAKSISGVKDVQNRIRVEWTGEIN
jgi:BON domain-containing protein